MPRQLVFIDDSGDPGFKEGASSSTFIMAGAVFISEKDASLVDKAIADYRRELGWKPEHEFKFRKAPKKVKIRFLKIVNAYHFEIYAVYIRKSDYPNMFKFSDDEKLYNWTNKELLSIMPLAEASVKIDGKYGRKHASRVKTYIRKELNVEGARKIKDFDVRDSVRDNLVQLADMVAGSINRSVRADRTDSDIYAKIIRNKIIKLKLLDLGKK